MQNKFQGIYEELKRDIVSGRYTEGALLPPEKDLALRFEVSRPTVAKALEQLRLEEAIERNAGVGTRVLPSKLTRGTRIGLLIARMGETEIFDPICAAIESESQKHHWDLLRPTPPVKSEGMIKTIERLCKQFIHDKVDGVFFAPVEQVECGEQVNKTILNWLVKARIQVVLLDRDVVGWSGQSEHDRIGIDNLQAGYAVGHHLVEQGCRKMVFATRLEWAKTVELRVMGCRAALVEADLDPDLLISMNVSGEATSGIIETILSHKPDALICANDATAAMLMPALLEAGVAIPEQLRVAGFDDLQSASRLSVPLTTYRQPFLEIGSCAVNAMMMRLQHPESAPHCITLQGELVMRASTA